MSASAPQTFITPEEYLAIERAAEFKSEYYDGRMYAMSGARLPHIRIVRSLVSNLDNQLRGGPCEVLANDMRVAINDTAFVYPDLVIVCGEPELCDAEFDNLLNPRVVIEILSPSTERWNRPGKFTHYQRLATLQYDVLIGQPTPAVERFDRQEDGSWPSTRVDRPDGILTLESVGVAIAIADIYLGVSRPDPSVDQGERNPGRC